MADYHVREDDDDYYEPAPVFNPMCACSEQFNQPPYYGSYRDLKDAEERKGTK